MVSPIEVVQAFLNDFCPVAAEGRVVYAGNREENRAFRMAHGLTKALILDYLTELVAQEYSKGPEPDNKGRQGQIWKFGPDYCTVPLYVKLADWRPGHPYFHCVSFKQAQPALHLPYKA